MIDINITCRSPGDAIVWTVPRTTSSSAGGALDHVGAITLQDNLTRIAGSSRLVLHCSWGAGVLPALDDPVRK